MLSSLAETWTRSRLIHATGAVVPKNELVIKPSVWDAGCFREGCHDHISFPPRQMSTALLSNCRIAGVSSCIPSRSIDNRADDASEVDAVARKKVVALAGVKNRHASDGTVTATDLCLQASRDLLERIEWRPDTIDALVLVTQSPDYLLPSSSCLVHKALGLSDRCATFDVGLGCSGYPYGLWLASMMLNTGMKRVLLLHGETPSLFPDAGDRATALLFGDAGSATAIERTEDAAASWAFALHTDGSGYRDLIIPAGGFRLRRSADDREHRLFMNGAGLFNFTIQRIPPLVSEVLEVAGLAPEEIDYFILHQSNQFMMKHVQKKCGVPGEKMPLTLGEFGNTGGPSVPLTLVQTLLREQRAPITQVMVVGYGVGLSWSAGIIQVDDQAAVSHSMLESSPLRELEHGHPEFRTISEGADQ